MGLGTSIVLFCAVLASLAVGVAVAYGLCLAMFGGFRLHARRVSVERAIAHAAKAGA